MFDSLFLCIPDVAHDRIQSVRTSSTFFTFQKYFVRMQVFTVLYTVKYMYDLVLSLRACYCIFIIYRVEHFWDIKWYDGFVSFELVVQFEYLAGHFSWVISASFAIWDSCVICIGWSYKPVWSFEPVQSLNPVHLFEALGPLRVAGSLESVWSFQLVWTFEAVGWYEPVKPV